MGAYGKSRRFKGIEAFAIRQRTKVAESLIHGQIKDNPKLSVLELGCGYSAANLQYLKSCFSTANFLGVDIDVDQSITQDGLTLQIADLELWYPQTTFDCVLSLAVVEHLINPLKHFKLICRCLSKNGVAILTTPTPASDLLLRLLVALGLFDKDAVSDHKHYLTDNGIQNMVLSTDLELMKHDKISLGMNHVCELRRRKQKFAPDR